MPHTERLANAIKRICESRNIPLTNGVAAFSDLIKALDEARFKAHDNTGSIVIQTYRTLGDEAAYHLAGLLSEVENGIYIEELKYVDPTMKRFRATVEKWERELAVELRKSE